MSTLNDVPNSEADTVDSVVNHQLSFLNNQITAVESKVKKLSSRLKPVLSPVSKSAKDQCVQPKSPEQTCQLAGDLGSFATRLVEINDWFDGILADLEI